MNDFALALAAYLAGSVPFAYLFTRLFRRADIRQVGSGNVGTMNTVHNIGFVPGLLTLLGDAGKGVLAVTLAQRYGSEPLLPLAAVFLVILGHNHSLFLGFQGGKGLASLLGGLLVLSPVTVLYLLLSFCLVVLFVRDANSAMGLVVLALPVFLYGDGGYTTMLLAGGTALLIVLKHTGDFRAYRNGRRSLFRRP